jgi:hypothetical protein
MGNRGRKLCQNQAELNGVGLDVTEKKIAIVELVKHGNLKLNSIIGMLSEAFYISNAVSVVRICVAGLDMIEKARVIVEPAKHGSQKRNSITEMVNEVCYSTIAVTVSRDIAGIVMLTIGRQLDCQTMNGLVGR